MRDHLVFGKVIVRLLKSYEGMGVVHIEALASHRVTRAPLWTILMPMSKHSTHGPLLGSTTVDCLWTQNVSESYTTRFDVKMPPDVSGGSESDGLQLDGGMIIKFTIIKPKPKPTDQNQRHRNKIKILEVAIA